MMHDSEARERAAAELGRLIFGKEAGFSGSEEATSETAVTSQAESAPVRSADAGAHGLEPEIHKSPAEQLAGLLLYGEGVPLQPWQRG